MKTRTIIIEIICISLIALWSYAAFSKLSDIEKSHAEMLNQVFPAWIANVLYWLIPIIELSLATLLLFTKTRLPGLYGSFILMSSFTLYIATVMTGVFGRVPCSCGGILKNIPYSSHLFFNVFFVVLASFGVSIMRRRTTFFTINPSKRKENTTQSEQIYQRRMRVTLAERKKNLP